MHINLGLLSASITFFIFSVTINHDLLKNNLFLALQITLAIPLFITSIMARVKLAYTPHFKKWGRYGFITFILGYAFLINTIGLLLSNIINLRIGMVFFGVCIVSDLIYTIMGSLEKKNWIKSLYKDLLYILILIFGGILPSMGVY